MGKFKGKVRMKHSVNEKELGERVGSKEKWVRGDTERS